MSFFVFLIEKQFLAKINVTLATNALTNELQWDQSLYAWLYLPSYDRSRVPDSLLLIADFFVLLCAACQLAAFRTGFSSEVADCKFGLCVFN